ncbi:serine/threonine protein phosphatase [bacterium]|nr:serine/threonine protein phosphatase [bacterium]
MGIKRLIAIGDIHGEIDKLNELLRQLKPQKEDTLVFLGDYIDRGRHSKEVVERLIGLSKETNCIFLKGNHEQMLLNLIRTKTENDVSFWLINGGTKTLDSYDNNFVEMLTLHGEFFKNLKPYYLTDKYLFIHAGINPSRLLNEQEEDDFLWIRDSFINSKHKLKQKVVFGHTPFSEPFVQEDKIGIDTGCGKGEEGVLTALICGDKEVFISSE